MEDFHQLLKMMMVKMCLQIKSQTQLNLLMFPKM